MMEFEGHDSVKRLSQSEHTSKERGRVMEANPYPRGGVMDCPPEPLEIGGGVGWGAAAAKRPLASGANSRRVQNLT